MKSKSYIVGSIIALAFYMISMLVGALCNVLLAFSSGQASWSVFKENVNLSGLLLMLVIGIVNHCLFSWLSVKIMYHYAVKRDKISPWYFRCAAITVLLFAILFAIFTSGNLGPLSYGVHVIGLLLFGRAKLKNNPAMIGQDAAYTFAEKNMNQVVSPSNAALPSFPGHKYKRNDIAASSLQSGLRDAHNFCPYCGSKISVDSRFCHNCGAKIE